MLSVTVKNLDPSVFSRFQWEERTFLTACLNIMLDTDGRDKGQTAGEGLKIKEKRKRWIWFTVICFVKPSTTLKCNRLLGRSLSLICFQPLQTLLSVLEYVLTSECVSSSSFCPFIYYQLSWSFFSSSSITSLKKRVFLYKNINWSLRRTPSSTSVIWDMVAVITFNISERLLASRRANQDFKFNKWNSAQTKRAHKPLRSSFCWNWIN